MTLKIKLFLFVLICFQFGISQNQDINVQGNGIDIFNGGGNSPNTSNNTDFGTLEQGKSAQSIFTIQNTHSGGSPSNNQLEVTGISIMGMGSTDFVISGISLPITINRNDETTFNVTYSPTCVDVFDVVLSILSNDPDEDPYTFNLRAEGIEVGAGPALILMENYPISVLEPSGLTYDKVNDELLTVSDNTAQVYRISTTGSIINTYGYSGTDTEGVTFYTPNKLLITEERSRDLIEYDYVNNTFIAHTMSYSNDGGGENQGIEGVSYDPATGTIFFLGEIPPVLVHADTNFNITNEYPLAYASDISATFFVEETGNLWLASHEESTIYRCNTDGSVINSFPVTDENGAIMAQMEGIAIDYVNQLLYAVDDTNQKLYVFAICGLGPDTTPPIANCKDISVTLDGSGTAVITANDINDCSYDFCGGIDNLSISQTTFTCNDIGVNSVTLTVTDLSGNTSTCIANVTVNGTVNQTTFSGGLWDNGNPTLGSSARFSSNYDTTTYGDIDACSCEIDGGVQVTIGADDYLNVGGNITVNGTLLIEHQGSVVQVDGDALVTNNGTINVELTTPVLQTRDWMVMGSPMSGETRGGVFGSAFLVLDHTPANFIPHPEVPAGGTNFADDNGDFWNQIPSGATPINVGEGYIVRPQSGYTDPANVNFYMTYSQGTLNNGDVTRSVIYNDTPPDINPDGTPNVYSNPYASAISGTDFINANALVNELYFWEHLTPPSSAIPGYGNINFSMGDISMFNLTMPLPAANDPGASTTPNGIISTGQGFGIKANGNGSVTFTNSMRRTTGNTTLRGPQENKDLITLRVFNEQYGIGSYTGIGFDSMATQGMDPGYDSNRLATAISLYSHLLDGTQQLGIQTREAFETGIKVSMGFASQVDAETEFTISIESLEGENLSTAMVYLFDHLANTITNLTQQDYIFKSDMGEFNERFTVLFEDVIILGDQDTLLEQIAVFPNPTQSILNIVSQLAIESFTIYDVRGREILNQKFTHQGNYQLDLSELVTAMYFLKIDTEHGSITKKINKE